MFPCALHVLGRYVSKVDNVSRECRLHLDEEITLATAFENTPRLHYLSNLAAVVRGERPHLVPTHCFRVVAPSPLAPPPSSPISVGPLPNPPH